MTQCGRALAQEAVTRSAALALSELPTVCVCVHRLRVVEHHTDSKSWWHRSSSWLPRQAGPSEGTMWKCVRSAKASGNRPGLPKTCNKLIVWNVCFWATLTSSQRKVGDVAPIISSFVLSPRLALATAPGPDAFHLTRTGNVSSGHREWQSLHLASAAAVLHGAERGLLGW